MPVVIHDASKVGALRAVKSGGSSNHAAAIDHNHSALGIEQLLFILTDADMNVTTDQVFIPAWAFDDYLITEIRAANPSLSLTAADGGVYQAAAKAGDPLVAAAQVYTALDATDKGLSLTLTAEAKGLLSTTPYLSLTGAQGAAATCDFYIFGIPLTEA